MSRYGAMRCFGFENLDDVLSVIIHVDEELENRCIVEKKFVISRCSGGWRFKNEINQYKSNSITSDSTAAKCLNDFLDDVIFLKDNGIAKSVRIEVIDILTNSFEFKFL